MAFSERRQHEHVGLIEGARQLTMVHHREEIDRDAERLAARRERGSRRAFADEHQPEVEPPCKPSGRFHQYRKILLGR